jgi:predicted nucleic acid-binding Zn ribbon protein
MANIRLPEHSHCIYCGDPIPFGEEYCCDECRDNEKIRQAKEKKKDYMFYAIAAATILILFAIRALTR